MDERKGIEGDGGFPGTWFIENRSAKGRGQSPQRRTASYVRLLKTLSAVIASLHPSRKILGRLVVSDVAPKKGPDSLSVVDDDALEIVLVIPWSLLLEEPGSQEQVLSRMMSNQVSIDKSRDPNEPTASVPSPPDHRRVQFIHCASLFEQRERQFSAVPPAAFCMAPALQKHGFEVSVDTVMLDPFVAPDLFPEHVREENRQRLDRILEQRPFCIAFTAMDFYLEELRCLITEIRAKDPEVVIAFGGPLVTLYPEKAPVYLEEGNVFIRGEADLAFGEVLACLNSMHAGENLSETELSSLEDKEGLFLRFGDTVCVSNLDHMERVESLDTIFQEKVDLGFIRKQHVSNGIHLHTTRGCPFQCSFCAKIHGSHVRAMASETIFRLLSAYRERIHEIRKTEGLSDEEKERALQVSFSDDDFLLARSRAKAFFFGLSDHPFRLKTVPAGIPSFLSGGGDGVGGFDPDLFDAIAAAKTRIRSFEIGTDDFCEQELSRLTKGHPAGYTLQEIEEVASRFEQLGISNRHFLILSNPDTEWSDLFEKLITVEDLSWAYAHFHPDPNPFVLAPMGTPLFEELVRQDRVDALTKKMFSVPGFPEFTHWVFNMATPRAELFCSDRSSHLDFFRRLSDLLKSRYRFSVVDDAYLHYLDVCAKAGPDQADSKERERILGELTRAVELRAGRIVSGIKDKRLLSLGMDVSAIDDSLLAHVFSGMFLMRETLGQVFPEAEFHDKREGLLGTLDAFFGQMEAGSSLLAGQPAALCRELDRALRFGRVQVRLHQAGCYANPASPLADSFVKEIQHRLLGMGFKGEAQEWQGLCSGAVDLVRLEVANDKQDARFVEDEAKAGRLFALMRLADQGSSSPDEVLRFVRAERVLERTIRDDLLTASETRVFLYDGIERLPLGFQDRFQQEFRISPFLDRDGFVCAVLSKFLASRAAPHSAEVHGTLLFQGLEQVLQGLVPEHLKAFSEWFFGRD